MSGAYTAVRVTGTVSAGREPHLVALVGLVVAGVAATVGATLLAHAGAESQPELSAFARASMVAVPMAVGAYAWHGVRTAASGWCSSRQAPAGR